MALPLGHELGAPFFWHEADGVWCWINSGGVTREEGVRCARARGIQMKEIGIRDREGRLMSLGRLSKVIGLLVTFALLTVPAVAEDAPEEAKPAFKLEGIFSNRLRYEFNEFFRSTAASVDNEYSFYASQTRFGAKLTSDRFDAVVVGQYVKLWDLPSDSLGAPGGPHGIGGVYFAHNRSEPSLPTSMRHQAPEQLL